MQSAKAYKCWLRHRTGGMTVKELSEFKKSYEFKDAQLVFFEEKRKQLTAPLLIDWIYRQLESLEKYPHERTNSIEI